ncbi:AAA family ATPase [Microvirga puerhi]|uniref:AAA family ATPase n=1 Tax=Microvirga puerhi TaxID=2876078 RepID=A0ABS7VP83_9HYPH|nr:AAA family ATPase [Microvirga puerhi]MBZ6077361.1 AAA family ATPase [Microvirga puerhi]
MSSQEEKSPWTEARRRHFERRSCAAVEARYLPTADELLQGMPFFADSMQKDMQCFAEHLLPRMRRKPGYRAKARVVRALERLVGNAGIEDIRELASAFTAASDNLPSEAKSWQLRCRIYLAHMYDHSAALALAQDAITMATAPEILDRSQDEAVDLIGVALGWLSFAAANPAFNYLAAVPRGIFWASLLNGVVSRSHILLGMIERNPLSSPKETETPLVLPRSLTTGPAAVVFQQIGNQKTEEGKRVLEQYKDILGKDLPLVTMLDLIRARDALRSEFPYAEQVIDRILADIPVQSYVQLRPTILVGSPGCGKSRFARKLLASIGMPHDVISCGGLSDGTFAGTPRRWSTGEPSLPVALIGRYKNAGPGIVLDEIEKVGSSRHNGNVHDALLSFLEQETASRYHDPYIQAPCDISYVSWLMTANSLNSVSRPLRDRCRVIEFPAPRPEDLSTLSRQIMIEMLAEQGLDERWLVPLDGMELKAILDVWTGESLRTLKRMIEIVLATRYVKQ